MNRHSVRRHMIFKDSSVELELLEKIIITFGACREGRYCSVQVSPFELIVKHADEHYALDMQGLPKPLEQFRVTDTG